MYISTVGHTGTYAWGETPSSLVGSILLGCGATPRYAERYPLGRRQAQGNAHQDNGDSVNQESPRL